MHLKTTAREMYLSIRAGVFNALRKLFRQQSLPPPGKPIKTIVIGCHDHLGDTVVSLPALAAIRKRYPDAVITCFALKYVAGMIASSGYVDTVIALKGRLSADFIHAFELRKQHPDLGIDLQTDYTMRNALLFATAGVTFSIGYNISGRGLFYTNPLELPPPTMHMVDCLLRIAREAGADDTERLPVLRLSPQAKSEFAAVHRDINEARECLAGIHPGGHYETQRWPAERFAAAADALSSRGAKIMLIGGDREQETIEQIRAYMKQPPLVFIPHDLHELTAAIGFCRVLLCNNSGPLHIASALGVPTVSTMGPTNASRWWPLGPNNHVIRKELPCISCNSGTCKIKSIECMNKITVDEVVAAAVGLLAI